MPPHSTVRFEDGEVSACPNDDYTKPVTSMVDCVSVASAHGLTFAGGISTTSSCSFPSGCIFKAEASETDGQLYFNSCPADQAVSEEDTAVLCSTWGEPPPPLDPPSPPPPSPSPPPPTFNKLRRGIIMSDQITATCLHHFSDAASWAYDYGHIFKTIDNLLWLNANNIELVPMVWGLRVDTQQTLGVDFTSCYLTQQQTDKVAGRVKCNGAQELTAQLGRLVNNLNVEPQYINTINEPYALKPSNPIHPVPVASSFFILRRWKTNAHAAKDFLDYVEAFSYICEAADAHGLKVISPTVRRGTAEDKEAWWLAHFIAACEADSTYGCDVDKIHAFDLHNYNCQATKWEDPDNFI